MFDLYTDLKVLLLLDDEESRSFVSSDTDKNPQDPADTASASSVGLSTGSTKLIGFLFDSTLPFLTMGNLSPKIGKFSRESLETVLTELEEVQRLVEKHRDGSGSYSEKPNTVSVRW